MKKLNFLKDNPFDKLTFVFKRLNNPQFNVKINKEKILLHVKINFIFWKMEMNYIYDDYLKNKVLKYIYKK